MSEGIITGTIYETRLRDKNCVCATEKKKKKKLNGETLRQVRTLYTHNADSHLKITQSVYFTH